MLDNGAGGQISLYVNGLYVNGSPHYLSLKVVIGCLQKILFTC